MPRLATRVALVAMLALPIPAAACPVCDRETGRQVRAGIFDEHFAANLVASAVPFGIFLGMAAAIHGGARGRREEGHQDA